jgi:hypothetical protein
MTYYLKYLKYKRKYLELKKLIGGRALDSNRISQLWHQRERNRKVYPVTYPELKKLNLKEYCWVGPPEENDSDYKYGKGFFIYKMTAINTRLDGFIKLGTYAIKMITNANIGDKTQFDTTKLPPKFFETAFKTTIELPDIPKGTLYDWSHEHNLWVYANNSSVSYKQDDPNKK